MKVVFFRWDVRRKTPYFGFSPTWVYTTKREMHYINEDKIKKLIRRLHKKYGSEKWKVVIYNFATPPYPIYYTVSWWE